MPVPTPIPTSPRPIEEVPLSGLKADPEAFRWPAIAVMIPSDSEQYGLSQASVVYEAVAEGNIPRFLAIFEQVQAEKIGPVRSARPYYVEWACPYGALFVHWGGSPQVFPMLSESDCVYNMEGINWEGAYFRREVNEQVPWNSVFTRSDLLYKYLESWELPRFVDYRGYPHKEDAPLESRPLSATISLSFAYPVGYSYDREGNDYLREYDGRPHLDRLSGEQLRAKNVAVIFVLQQPIPGDDQGRMQVQTTGEGKALLFLDGTLIEGRWVKTAPEAEMRFLDSDGKEIAFNRGTTWIEVVAPDQEVTYHLGQPYP